MTAFGRPGTAPGATSEQDDSILVARVVDADSGAFKELYDRHAPWLQARLMRRCNNHEVVADVLRDTFVAVWKDAHAFRGDGEAAGWLWGIAFRRLVSRPRSRKNVAEAANAAARLRALPASAILEPRVLAGFQTLFDRLDHRLADIVEDGIDRGAFVERIRVPQVGAHTKRLICPLEEKFVPVSRASDLEVVRTLREQLRPRPVPTTPTSPGSSRAELHTALLHRPGTSEVGTDTPRL